MISSLQTRLLLAVGLLAVAAVAAVALSARQSTRKEFERFQLLERLRDTDEASASLDRVSAALDGRCCAAAAVAPVVAGLAADQAIFVFDPAGVLAVAAGAAIAPGGLRATYLNGLLEIDARAAQPGRSADMHVAFTGVPFKSIRLADGSAASVLVVTLPRPDGDRQAAQFLGSIDRRLLIATTAVAALAMGLTWALTRRIVGPIADLRDATRGVAAGDLSRRVEVRGSDEVAELATGFNAMASGLERQETLRRNLVHDVAHELRTPLTALRCRVETLIDGMAADPNLALRQVNEEVLHLSQLVSDLEELARAEARELAFTMTPVGLAEVCRSAARAAGLDRDPRLRWDLDEALTVRADAVRMRQIVMNLLTNADRHTPSGGQITVRAGVRDASAVIEVHNTGSALGPEMLDRVFDRFYRADPARQRATGGSGLGLAIVKHLAEAQGGRVRAASDESGVTFSVAFAIG